MLTVLQLISLSVGLWQWTRRSACVDASAAVTESTSGVAFLSLHLVAFGRPGEKTQPLLLARCIDTIGEFRIQDEVASVRQRMCT